MSTFYVITISGVTPQETRGPALTINRVTDEDDPLRVYADATQAAKDFWHNKYAAPVVRFVVDCYYTAPVPER